MSPFEKKVNAYQRSALNRSNSRGPQTQQAIGQKPPKLQQQTSSTSWQSKRQSASPYHGAERGATIEQPEWHGDLRVIRSRLVDFDNTVNQFLAELGEKQFKMEELLSQVD